MTNKEIKRIFLENGFSIKEGQTDLKPYVYQAARALLQQKQDRPRPSAIELQDAEIGIPEPVTDLLNPVNQGE